MNNKEQVLIESMFKYADAGIDPVILIESVSSTSILVEASGDAASLFSRLNDGRKELMKKIENIDWKEWLQKMKETVKKIIHFITAPVRTYIELITGRTTLREVGQRLKQVWTNLRTKKNKTPEEKTAEKAMDETIKNIDNVIDITEERIKRANGSDEQSKKTDDTGDAKVLQYQSRLSLEFNNKAADLSRMSNIVSEYVREIENDRITPSAAAAFNIRPDSIGIIVRNAEYIYKAYKFRNLNKFLTSDEYRKIFNETYDLCVKTFDSIKSNMREVRLAIKVSKSQR